MDPLDIIENVSHVFPHFQPIMNSEEYKVIGYEVLGQIEINGEAQSLAPFFLDANVPVDYKWEVDKEIYHKAVKQALDDPSQPKLFFNIDPTTLVQLDCLEELMETFERFTKQGLNPNRVVFEFRVNDYSGDFNDLSHMLLYIKASGYQVALDDIRTHDTNLDFFSKLEPNMIKVDLSDLKEGMNFFSYKDVLNALATFSRKIGAALHFKGIQSFHQLHTAWKHGGRYLQGSYLQNPASHFIDPFSSKAILEETIHSFIDMAHRKLQRQIDFIRSMDNDIAVNLKGKQLTTEELVEVIARATQAVSFRVYICDLYGYQKSANWLKLENNQWHQDLQAKGKNWSWRTYFLDQIMQMRHRKMGMLSDKYRDIETNDLIRTYSYPVDDQQYVFIDLDPDFLYENDWLR
ncbi:diguanylate phosphodiesterase [Salipaludibacillus keqinensis]|uniref:Diguanylate phosphodiesterase n=1 Tax=Salipaludibacillus keqinensis TaxID=2045207 RepID=A0A323TK37_9BACI|nr:EAL-associated domain-containing protein [Salipaludibacillus keqinensis]PYZ95258.1 diguanylate phosphodiesterase [Salipaludibacillus keqinensis]